MQFLPWAWGSPQGFPHNPPQARNFFRLRRGRERWFLCCQFKDGDRDHSLSQVHYINTLIIDVYFIISNWFFSLLICVLIPLDQKKCLLIKNIYKILIYANFYVLILSFEYQNIQGLNFISFYIKILNYDLFSLTIVFFFELSNFNLGFWWFF